VRVYTAAAVGRNNRLTRKKEKMQMWKYKTSKNIDTTDIYVLILTPFG
jgi:hypothetical protein